MEVENNILILYWVLNVSSLIAENAVVDKSEDF